jgi:Flp pilus assembly protein CpaB
MNAQKLNAPLLPDEMLLRRQFETPTTPSPTPTFVIPHGKIAVSISLDIPTQVAGNVKRGDQVAVFCGVQVKDKSYPDDLHKYTITLIPHATVIAVGEAALPTSAAPTPNVTPGPSGVNAPTIMPSASAATISGLARYLVTLSVTPQQAQWLISGAKASALYLGLLGAGASVPPAPPAELGAFGVNPSRSS